MIATEICCKCTTWNNHFAHRDKKPLKSKTELLQVVTHHTPEAFLFILLRRDVGFQRICFSKNLFSLFPTLPTHPLAPSTHQRENCTYFMYFFLSRDFCVAVESVALSLGLFTLSYKSKNNQQQHSLLF